MIMLGPSHSQLRPSRNTLKPMRAMQLPAKGRKQEIEVGGSFNGGYRAPLKGFGVDSYNAG